MTGARTARAGWPGRNLLDGPAHRLGGVVREALQQTLWQSALSWWCGGVCTAGGPLGRPAIYVANHASHVDTAAVRAAFGSGRRRLAVAAAEDYFFSTRLRATAFTLAVGAYPFPRCGRVGLDRAAMLLDGGWSVLLYPQGTRGGDGNFRPGVLRLASAGWTVVPVGLAGTEQVLPKGARWPRRHRVGVAFGTPLDPKALGAWDGLTVLSDAVAAAAARAGELVR